MKLTLAIPFFNQLNDVKGIMGLLKFVTSENVEWLIIDNGSTDPVESFFRDVLRPKRLNYVRNPENVGMVATYNQIFSLVETDSVAILHNDVFVYEKNWDQRVLKIFDKDSKLGSAGFFGAQGCGPIGERIQDPQFPGQMAGVSSMLEAESHGRRLSTATHPAAILDGFAMIFRMELIRGIGGLDRRYLYHHLYDRDLPLSVLAAGYRNAVISIPCHHQSGVTANRHEYQAWIDRQLNKKSGGDAWTHEENSRLFAKKWAGVLPVYIEDDYSFRTGARGRWQFKGDSITKLNAVPKK
jgi:GT2 family glycosyltransferase